MDDEGLVRRRSVCLPVKLRRRTPSQSFLSLRTRAKEKRGWLIDGVCVRSCVRNDERDSVKLSLSGLVELLHQLGNNEKRAQQVSRLWRRSPLTGPDEQRQDNRRRWRCAGWRLLAGQARARMDGRVKLQKRVSQKEYAEHRDRHGGNAPAPLGQTKLPSYSVAVWAWTSDPAWIVLVCVCVLCPGSPCQSWLVLCQP